MERFSSTVVDVQERAAGYQINDIVASVYDVWTTGRVVAVWPAIGMVDVEFPIGTKRMPVEEIQQINAENTIAHPPTDESVPGGAGTVGVSGGPLPEGPSSTRVAKAYGIKQALYWTERDRRYRGTAEECAAKGYMCPRCKTERLRPAVYKREDGRSEKLLGCHKCLFLVKYDSITNHAEEAF